MNSWIDPIFNMLKVKFDLLNQLEVLDKNKSSALVFINLEDPFRYLINQRNDNQLKATQYTNADIQLNLISNIINYAQHYRLYCKKNGYDSRIFLYWNYPKSNYNNRSIWVKYREEYDKQMGINVNAEYITKCLEDSQDVLLRIVPFINQVYVINGGVVESSLVPHLIVTNGYDKQDFQHIIISRDPYDYQYLQYGYTIVEPRGDKSMIVDSANVIDHMKEKGKIKNPMTAPVKLLPFILSLLGNPHRSIPKIEGMGLVGIIKAINTAINRSLITENTTDVDMLSSILAEPIKERFKRNFALTDLSTQIKKVTPVQINTLLSQLVDKFDDRTLKAMNEKYFINDPLMLIDTASEQTFKGNCDKLFE